MKINKSNRLIGYSKETQINADNEYRKINTKRTKKKINTTPTIDHCVNRNSLECAKETGWIDKADS